MTKLPEGKSRLDLVREGLVEGGIKKQGRLIVSLDRLKEDPKNERRTFRNMAGLVASIKNVGLIEPITVTPEEGETSAVNGPLYRIVTGHRRYRAAKAAGLSQVEVLIRQPEDARSRRIKSIISNVQREDVGPVEMAEALQGLLDEDQGIKTQDELARLIGKDKTWVSGMLKILSLPARLQQKVGTSQLAISYDAMIRVARVDDPKLQDELIDALVTGATNRDIRQRIGQIKGKGASGATTSAVPKPKRVYHTKYKAVVIVQSERAGLSGEQVIGALQEALGQATDS